jgi:hypothetical protein
MGKLTPRFWMFLYLALAASSFAVFLVTLDLNLIAAAGISLGMAIIFSVLFLWFGYKYVVTKRFFGRIGNVFRRLFVKIVGGVRNTVSPIINRLFSKGIFRLSVFKDEKVSLRKRRARRDVSPYKSMKWKDLTNDTDKVRFVYFHFMRRKIKKGFKHVPADTPAEVCYAMWRKQGAFPEVGLFDFYNDYRYDETKVTNGEADGLRSFI